MKRNRREFIKLTIAGLLASILGRLGIKTAKLKSAEKVEIGGWGVVEKYDADRDWWVKVAPFQWQQDFEIDCAGHISVDGYPVPADALYDYSEWVRSVLVDEWRKREEREA